MKERKILKILPVPVPPGHTHPEPEFSCLPKHEFTLGIVAPKGSGKTTLIINLLHYYKKYFHDIFIFSPTVKSDDKWNWLKKQKVLSENKPLKRWIKAEQARKNGVFKHQIVQPPPLGNDFDQDEKEEFDGKIPEENFYYSYDEDDLNKVLAQQLKIINALEKHGQPKYLADRILLIFDDLVGSTLFSMAKDNLFKGFNTRHRHYSASVIMVSQGYKEIPRTVRINWTALILFEIANDKEVALIYEENTMGYKIDVWLEMFKHATNDKYGFLYMNVFFERNLRCWKNFDKVLYHEADEEEENKFKKIKKIKN